MLFRRIFQRPRTRTMLLFSIVLSLLCFVIVLYPTSNSDDVQSAQRRFETQAIVFESQRREYLVLNRDFFEFLSKTGMECLIQVEPSEDWSREASVKTKLINNDILQDEESTTAVLTDTHLKNIPRNTSRNFKTKYILVYRHFEQLSKTTENLIQLAAVARRWGRLVVQPNVQNSRFSLGTEFRAFPLDTYFNVSTLNEILIENGYSKLVKLKNFTQDCSYINFGVKTTLVHFLYSDGMRGNTKSWFGMNDKELHELVENSLHTGWTECNFINKHLSVAKSLDGIEIGRQVCVNPEVLRTEEAFNDKILREDKCVIFLEWRGFGHQRTHFHPRFLPFLTPVEVKHHISASNLIKREVTRFLQTRLPDKYISVHLRTERLFEANLYTKLKSCIDHIVHLVKIFRSLREVDAVFLATDLTEFGSDLFVRKQFYTTNETGKYIISRQDITDIHMKVARRLNATIYKPTRKPFSKDKGIFSLVEMNILKRGIDIITLGRGTFHAWTVSAFRQHHAGIGHRSYTIAEVCGV